MSSDQCRPLDVCQCVSSQTPYVEKMSTNDTFEGKGTRHVYSTQRSLRGEHVLGLGRLFGSRFFRSKNHKNRFRATCRFLRNRFFHFFSDQEKPTERNRLAIWSIFLEKPTGWRCRFFLSKTYKPGHYPLSHARTSIIPYGRAW